jgi:aminotransferase
VARGILRLPESFYRQISRDYVKKRDLLCGTLKEAGLTPSVPKGAYYVLADASILPGRTSKEKSMFLLRETGVASVAGSAFYNGSGGENLLRFCFAKTDEELAQACRQLIKLTDKMSHPKMLSHTR